MGGRNKTVITDVCALGTDKMPRFDMLLGVVLSAFPVGISPIQ